MAKLASSEKCFECFFFSSRRRHTRYIGDWSSDVCSSDLPGQHPHRGNADQTHHGTGVLEALRQVRIDPPHRDHGQRCLLFPALPQGRTSRRHQRNKWAPMLKTVYSLPALRELLVAANRRYLEFLSTIDDPGAGINKLTRVSQTVQQNERSYPGFNFFDDDDQMLFEALARGEFNISGLQNKTLRPHLPDKSSGQVSRLLKRLRLHGLLKKVGRTYKYYLTTLGKEVIAAGLNLKEIFLV